MPILSELFSAFPFTFTGTLEAISITGVVADSRQVQPGNLFVAVRGDTSDGHRYIHQALASGAVAVVGTESRLNLPVPYLQVGDSRRSLAHLAAAFYGFPARKLVVIGVTGTDGKTTTTNLLHRIMLAAGLRAGMISTVNAVIGDQVLDTGFHVTTPDAPDVQRYLAHMVASGLTHVVLETTSHGLEQYRVEACEFDIAVVTNITHEHLDFHGNFTRYRSAKGRLFTYLGDTPPKIIFTKRLAVLNRDDDSYDYLNELTNSLADVQQVSYGLQATADVRAVDTHQSDRGLSFVIQGASYSIPIKCHLIGSFNVSNCLAAATAALHGLEVQHKAVQAGIASLKGVPGRMESIDLGQDFTAIVDFAHTPNALLRSLETARQLTSGRLIAVFGSAGLRDRQKRRLMAEISIQLADATVLTAEDPRTESLDEILAEMAMGAQSQGGVEGVNFWRVPDRGEAIRFAVSLARPGDLVIACGKGHEQSMCFGTVEYPWDDRLALRVALSELLDVEGLQMPMLPTHPVE